MRENTGHALVAAEIIAQVDNGEVPAMTRAAEAVGYNAKNSHLIAKAPTFQKALFDRLPYHYIAQKYEVQTKASRVQQRVFLAGHDIDKIIAGCEDSGWEVLSRSLTPKGNHAIVFRIPNYDIMYKTLDQLMKLGGFYAAEKHEITKPLEDLTDDELMEELAEQGVIEQKAHVQVISEPSTPT